MSKTKFNYFYKGIQLQSLTTDPSDNIEGSMWYNSAENAVKAYSSGAVRTLVNTDEIQTITNKTISANDNTIEVAYGFGTENINTVLLEIESDLDTKASSMDLDTHTFAPNGVHGIAGSVVGTTDTQTLTNKTIAASGNTITTAATGNLTSTELNAALAELQTDIDTRVTGSDLFTHEGTITAVHGVTGYIVGTTDVQGLSNKTINVASNVISTAPSGNLTSVELNAALAELQDDIDTRALDSAKANTNLGNLTSPTAINQALVPNAHNAIDLGSSSYVFRAIKAGDVSASNISSFERYGTSANRINTDKSFYLTTKDISSGGGQTGELGLITGNQNATGLSGPLNLTTGTSTAQSGVATVKSGDASGSGNSGGVTVKTGEATGSGDSGDVLLETGAAGGTRGKIVFQDGTEGTVGHVWTSTDANGSGSWAIPSGGGGQGGINYAVNPDFEIDVTTGVTDGASYFTSAAETTNKIRGTQSLAITMSSSFTGTDFQTLALDNIDPADKGKAITLSFEYATDSNYTSDDVEVRIYDNTNAAYINVNATEDFDGKLKATSGETDSRKFIGQWYAASDSVDYDVHIFGLSAPGSNSKIIVDNVRVGPESFYNMPIVSSTERYTPTVGGMGTLSTNVAVWSRHGNKLRVNFDFTTGTHTGDGFTITIPDGLNIDFSSSTGFATSRAYIVGKANASVTPFSSPIYAYSTIPTKVTVTSDSANYGSGTAGTTWANSSNHSGWFEVPILEWANSSTTMSTTQANLQTVKAIYSTNTASTFTHATSAPVDFEDKSKDTHNSVTTGAAWKFTAPTNMVVDVNARVTFATHSWTAGQTAAIYIYKGGVQYDILCFYQCETASTRPLVLSGSNTVELEAGEYIQIYAVQNSGSTRALDGSSKDNQVTITQKPDFTTIGLYSFRRDHSVQRFTSGSGTYTTPEGVKYIKVKMVGGGGGGMSGGTTGTVNVGSVGGNTTFGSSTAYGGNGGGPGIPTGGTVTIAAGASNVISAVGGQGGGWFANHSYAFYLTGGQGGVSVLGGNGGGQANGDGSVASANSGSGGGGGGAQAVAGCYAGAGGGAGGYAEFIINNPSATYSYSVGGGGAGGYTGSYGYFGAAGGSGVIIVEEFYL